MLHCINTFMTRVVCKQLYWYTHLTAIVPHTSCLLSRSSDFHSQHFCDVCKYMFRMDWANVHNNQCSNCMFKVNAFCHHCFTVHKVPDLLGSTMLCLSNSSLSNTSHHNFTHYHHLAVNNESTFFIVTMICMTTMTIQLARLLTMTAIVCMILVTVMSLPLFSKVVVPMTIQRTSSIDWTDISTTNISSHNKIGFISHKTDDIPVTLQFQIPSSCQLNMSPHELVIRSCQ